MAKQALNGAVRLQVARYFREPFQRSFFRILGFVLVLGSFLGCSEKQLTEEQGFRDPQWQLGQRYATGEGVTKDVIEAYKWSVIVGDERQRDKLAARMTPAEVAEGQKRADKFTPQLELDPEQEPASDIWLWIFGVAATGLWSGAIGVWIRTRRSSRNSR